MVMKVKKQAGGCKLILEGDLTIYQATEIYEKFKKQLAACKSIDIDLQSVTEIDTAGVQVMLAVKRKATLAGIPVSMTMHSEPVVEVFELMNIAHEFGDPIVLSNRATG
jgi:anti-sigma B factor antagonist